MPGLAPGIFFRMAKRIAGSNPAMMGLWGEDARVVMMRVGMAMLRDGVFAMPDVAENDVAGCKTVVVRCTEEATEMHRNPVAQDCCAMGIC